MRQRTTPTTKVSNDAAVKLATDLLADAARAFGRDCTGTTVGIDVYRIRLEKLQQAARLFTVAEERRDLEAD